MASSRGSGDQLVNDTLLALQRSVNDLHGVVGELNGKVGTFIDQMARQDDRTTTLTGRVDKVENRQHWYAGLGTAIGAIVGFLGSRIGVHVTGS